MHTWQDLNFRFHSTGGQCAESDGACGGHQSFQVLRCGGLHLVCCDLAFFCFLFVLFLFCLLINTGSDLVYPELPLASGPRVQQVTQSAVSAGTWYQRLYFLLVLGKHLPVKTVSRLILSYTPLWLGHHRNTDAHREKEHNCGLIYRSNKPVERKIQPNERAV